MLTKGVNLFNIHLMAFGTSLPKSSRSTYVNGGYVPNPGISRLWEGFKAQSLSFGFTDDQLKFVKAFFTGQNVFVTGAGGTGKSYVLKALFDYLHAQHISVARTGSTGVGAFNIGGQTIHSFAGLGLADEHVESLIEKIHKKPKVKARIRAAEIMFIDEISMAKGDLLNKLNGVLQYFRDSGDPWGGIQVIASGDFLQLPPVFKADEIQELAFHCRAWQDSNIKVVVLKKVVRQQGDAVLLTVLNDLRVGDTKTLHLLDSRIGATWTDTEIEPVRVFCKNVDVNSFNQERLAKLTTQSKTFIARDSGEAYHTESFNKNCPAPQTLELKIGAQVMLLANLDVQQGFVNGSVGVVKGFNTQGVTVKFTTGSLLVDHNEWNIKEQVVGLDKKIIYRTVATRRQIPLKVCYAMTAHKVQGATLDRAVIDVTEAFATGQAYTALSRIRNLQSLSIVGKIPHSAIRVNPEAVKFYEEIERAENPF